MGIFYLYENVFIHNGERKICMQGVDVCVCIYCYISCVFKCIFVAIDVRWKLNGLLSLVSLWNVRRNDFEAWLSHVAPYYKVVLATELVALCMTQEECSQWL